jgi:hypothetical protein
VVDVTATGKGCGPAVEVCRELKTAGLLAIGPPGLMAGGPEDHFTDSRELYVLVEGDEWAHVEALDPNAGYWARRSAELVNWRARGEKTGSTWVLVAGLAGHGLKDLWQHRSHFVANTQWWPPFCMVVDWVVAAIIVGEITAGMQFG